MEKIWLTFQGLGNIAFAYSYSVILIEIQVLLPTFNRKKKKVFGFKY